MTSSVSSPPQTFVSQVPPNRPRSCISQLQSYAALDLTDEALYAQARGRAPTAESLAPTPRAPRAESCPPRYITPPQIPIAPCASPAELAVETHSWRPVLVFAVALGLVVGRNYAFGQGR